MRIEVRRVGSARWRPWALLGMLGLGRLAYLARRPCM
jgi:hypothetical protein